MSKKQINHIGIDYGSKVAGTTVICYQGEDDQLHLLQSKKKQDADKMILDFCSQYAVDNIFIDAPLSLPGVYTGIHSCADYFYRKADKETRAMSPMFLGGLTARAMKLSSSVDSHFIEVYPKLLVSILEIQHHYKKDLSSFLHQLQHQFEETKIPDAQNWHQADSILAYLSGKRYLNDNCSKFGDVSEGQIYV